MLRALSLTALLALSASCAATPRAAAPRGSGPIQGYELNVSLVAGERSLDEDDWKPIEDQDVYGIIVDGRSDGQPLGWEAGLLVAREDEEVFDGTLTNEFRSTTRELFGGIRGTYSIVGPLRLYVGGGVTILDVEQEINDVDTNDGDEDDDVTGGFYGQVGAYVQLGGSANLGVQYRRVVGTDIDVFGGSGDVDYGQFTFFIGFSF